MPQFQMAKWQMENILRFVHAPCRDDPAALREAKAHANAKLVPVLNGQSLITRQDRPGAVLLELQKASEHINTNELVFLGLRDGTPVFSAACKESITKLAKGTDTEACLSEGL